MVRMKLGGQNRAALCNLLASKTTRGLPRTARLRQVVLLWYIYICFHPQFLTHNRHSPVTDLCYNVGCVGPQETESLWPPPTFLSTAPRQDSNLPSLSDCGLKDPPQRGPSPIPGGKECWCHEASIKTQEDMDEWVSGYLSSWRFLEGGAQGGHGNSVPLLPHLTLCISSPVSFTISFIINQ